VVRGRVGLAPCASSQPAALEVVVAVEVHDGRRAEGRCRGAVGEPPLHERGHGGRPVAQDAQWRRGAARDRRGRAGDGGEDGALAQQRRGVVLVGPVQVEQHLVAERRESRQEPGRERVGVDRHRQDDGAAGLGELACGVGGEQLELSGQAQDGASRLGDPDWLGPHQQHPSGGVLERLEPLADRRRREVQGPGRSLECPGVDGRAQRTQLTEVQVHAATLMLLKDPSLGFTPLSGQGRRMSSALLAAVSGLALGLALIVAIGAQNAFVLRQGLRGEHVVAVVAVCALSDLALIAAGIAGTGALLDAAPAAVMVIRWAGAAFLLGYGALAARRALWPAGALTTEAAQRTPPLPTVLTASALT